MLKHVISGMLVSLLFVSGVSATVYFDSNQPFMFVDKNTYGMFIGIDDSKNNGFKGSVSAYNIGGYFAEYGGVQTGVGKTGFGGKSLASSTIGSWIANVGYSIPNTFHNADNFLLYLAGHGVVDNGTTKINIGSSFFGLNNYFIADYELASYLKTIPSNINKIVIIDSCYSGGFISELSELKNTSIITSSPSDKVSYYNNDGIGLLSYGLTEFFKNQNGAGFEFDYLAGELQKFAAVEKYDGLQVYEAGLGDPHIFTANDWNIQTYQSPTYAPVPEPSTIFLLGLGLAGVAVRQFRKKS